MTLNAEVLNAIRALKGVAGEYLSREEVAALLGISLRTVDLYIARGTLKPLRIRRSRLLRFRRSEVLELLEPVSRK